MSFEYVDAHVLVQDIEISGSDRASILLRESSNITFENVDASDWSGGGMISTSSVVDFNGGNLTGLVLRNSGGWVTSASIDVWSVGVQTMYDDDVPFPSEARHLEVQRTSFRGPGYHMGKYPTEGTSLANGRYEHQLIEGCTFENLDWGVSTWFESGDNVSLTLRGNRFLGSSTGASLEVPPRGEVTVEGNVFARNIFGLVPWGSQMTVTLNRFHENRDGILFHGVEDGETYRTILRNNSFASNLRGSVWYQLGSQSYPGDVDARWNYWGSSEGPKPVRVCPGHRICLPEKVPEGSRDAVPEQVRFEPWLTEPPEGLPELPDDLEDYALPDWSESMLAVPEPGAGWAALLMFASALGLPRRWGSDR